MNPEKLLDTVVPRGQVVIPNWPVVSESVRRRCLELLVRNADRIPTPEVQSPPDLPSPVPVERAVAWGRVRVPSVVYEEVSRVGTERHAAGLDGLVAQDGLGPREDLDLGLARRRRLEVGLEIEGPASLQQERVQATLTELFGRPAARSARPDHHGVVGPIGHGRPVSVPHTSPTVQKTSNIAARGAAPRYRPKLPFRHWVIPCRMSSMGGMRGPASE